MYEENDCKADNLVKNLKVYCKRLGLIILERKL